MLDSGLVKSPSNDDEEVEDFLGDGLCRMGASMSPVSPAVSPDTSWLAACGRATRKERLFKRFTNSAV